MTLKIPSTPQWVQSNYSDVLGNISQSFNIDLESNRGRIRTTRTKLIASGNGSTPNFGQVAAITYFSAALRVFSGVIAGDNLWEGGNSPFDSLSLDTSSTNVAVDDGDAKVFNNLLYATNGSEITRWDGSTENIVSSSLTDNTHHLLEVFTPDGAGERLFVTQGNDKVWSVNQSNVLATSSSYTLNLALTPFYQITGLSAGTDRLWIAVSSAGNNSGAGDSWVFSWDGVTANAPLAKYRINASRIMALAVKDDIPFIVDNKGRLMGWNGGAFKELDKFPVKGDKLLLFTSTNMHQNALHPRGMAVDEDEILINISNLAEGSTGSTTIYNDFPAGVWAWSERTGLYHKYSPSYQAVADTGTTNLTDFGQFRAAYAGVLKVVDIDGFTSSDGGRVMFGMGYYTNASDNLASNITYGLFTDDTHDDTQKAGWLTLPKVDASNFIDNWQKIYTSLTDLITTGDLVAIKYRTTEIEPIVFTATWTGIDRFNTTTDLSSFEQGDEISFLHGEAGGAIAHIQTLSTGAGSSVILDRSFSHITAGDTTKAKIMNFKRVQQFDGKILDGKTIGKKGQWIQLKAYLQWTGARELYGFTVVNTPENVV